jgi:hypothetical protein
MRASRVQTSNRLHVKFLLFYMTAQRRYRLGRHCLRSVLIAPLSSLMVNRGRVWGLHYDEEITAARVHCCRK